MNFLHLVIMDSFDFQPLVRSIKDHIDDDSAFRFDSFKSTISDLDITSRNDEDCDVEMTDADITMDQGLNLNSLSLGPGKRLQRSAEEVNDVEMKDIDVMSTNISSIVSNQELHARPIDKKNVYNEDTVEPESLHHSPQLTPPASPKLSSSKSPSISARSLLSPTRLGAKLAVSNALVKYTTASKQAGGPAQHCLPSIAKQADDADKHFSSATTSDPIVSASSGLPQANATINSPHLPMPTPVWIWHHHNVPYILSTYLQLLLNAVALIVTLYLGLAVVKAFWKDVDIKLDEMATMISIEISQCTRNYIENDCRPGLRAPALESQCLEWEKCMERDPFAVGRFKVSIETMAEVINSFIEPFSFRSIVVTMVFSLVALYISNFAFGFFRAKTLVSSDGLEKNINQRSSSWLSHPPLRDPVLLKPWEDGQNGGDFNAQQLKSTTVNKSLRYRQV